jgi:hypothetical protein
MRTREIKTNRVVADTVENHAGVAFATATDVAAAKAEAIASSATDMPLIPTATVAATGNSQATAAAVTTGFTYVTAADATKAVTLPTAAAGQVVIIKNGANAVLPVYPGASDKINAGAANASLDLAAYTSVMLVAYDAEYWYSLPLLPS